MIKKIKTIDNLGVYKNFKWDDEVREGGGQVATFQYINIIYGRNYSGKTTLSRILRAMETGLLSDKFENPSFSVALADGSYATQTALTSHGKTIRVFNEDFVRSNLRFITNPDDSIEPFAILGDDNNKIEKEIEALEAELGSNELGRETGLYAQHGTAKTKHTTALQKYKKANDDLEKQLSDKATDKEIGIKYKSDRFGDQNYNIQKLKNDIATVQTASYQSPSSEQLAQYEKLISEIALQPIPPFHAPDLNFQSLVTQAETLLTKKISESDKIETLVKNAVLNRWVNEGRTHHKNKLDKCAFCDHPISVNRWAALEKHFDEESDQLEKDINALIGQVETEKKTTSSALSIDKTKFYSKFHLRFNELDESLKTALAHYGKSLDVLTAQLKSRKEDALNPKTFENPVDFTEDLQVIWSNYKTLCAESDSYTASLGKDQKNAKDNLRLKEVSDYLLTIGFEKQQSTVAELKKQREDAEQEKNCTEVEIRSKVDMIASKRRELNDEEKGAKKVNEYLKNFFGHRFLTLEARQEQDLGDQPKQIRFEVIRDGKKAHHLSEGECSLLAFCYFLAKLDDIDTRNSKPIIWIDDPISSLDGNHIFFVYSLLGAEIVSTRKFEQLFVSTHNLDFLKYLKRLGGKYIDGDGKKKDYQKGYFVVARKDKFSEIKVMPKYLKEYVTEFNYLFQQIHKCAAIEAIDDTNYSTFYNFANNARKFFEIYLYYKYPDQGMNEETLRLFFGEDRIPAVLTDRINNEYSHLCGVFERGSTPVEVPEMQTAAKHIIERLKQDSDQYSSLLKSIGIEEASEAQP